MIKPVNCTDAGRVDTRGVLDTFVGLEWIDGLMPKCLHGSTGRLETLGSGEWIPARMFEVLGISVRFRGTSVQKMTATIR